MSDRNDATAPVTYNSYFWFDLNLFDPALSDYKCTDGSPPAAEDLREATPALDLDSLHPPPYSIE